MVDDAIAEINAIKVSSVLKLVCGLHESKCMCYICSFKCSSRLFICKHNSSFL